jgi:L-ascorbate metabolism protein UlaG (beta-lactamase superfamily)
MTTVQFAGHSAVLLRTNKFTVAIDPWLEGNPVCPDDLRTPGAIDYIVLTHGHSDHASDTVRLAKLYNATVFATFELAMLLIAEGIPQENVVPMNKGGTVQHDQIRVSLTHAMHSNSFDTANGAQYAGEACGVVVELEGKTFYHAGDTALFSDMSLIANTYAPEIGFLPIGDRFTMGPEEAAQAAKILGLAVVIPIHFNTFPLLTGTAEQFQKALKNDSIEVIVLEPGQTHDVQ